MLTASQVSFHDLRATLTSTPTTLAFETITSSIFALHDSKHTSSPIRQQPCRSLVYILVA